MSDAGRPSSSSGGGRAQADRELRIALMVALPLLAIGQVLLLLGLRWVAIGGIAVPGTIAALVLARRWTRLAADG